MDTIAVTYIGGPTALIEWRGVRLLTDPTFDPAGSSYTTAEYTLHKTQSPALQPGDVFPVDAVLLSHDQHFDNLDRAGREFLPRARRTLTTVAAAGRLDGTAIGLSAWETHEIEGPPRVPLRVTATPARHGPAGGDRGPVVGFALGFADALDATVYVSGDTVWFDGVREVASRFSVRVAVINAGAARVAVAGDAALTLTAADAVTLARAMPQAVIVPLHFEGWKHFSESRADIDDAFRSAGLAERLRWLEAGIATPIQTF